MLLKADAWQVPTHQYFGHLSINQLFAISGYLEWSGEAEKASDMYQAGLFFSQWDDPLMKGLSDADKQPWSFGLIDMVPLNHGWNRFPGAKVVANQLHEGALQLFQQGQTANGIRYVAGVGHLIQDMNVPFHDECKDSDTFDGQHGKYESYANEHLYQASIPPFYYPFENYNPQYLVKNGVDLWIEQGWESSDPDYKLIGANTAEAQSHFDDVLSKEMRQSVALFASYLYYLHLTLQSLNAENPTGVAFEDQQNICSQIWSRQHFSIFTLPRLAREQDAIVLTHRYRLN